ncbi:MAG: terminase, partial [Chloroflexota bacterium]
LDPSLLLRRAGTEPYPWQIQAASDRAARLLFLTSRQAGKSTVSAALALHTALYQSEATVLLVAPTLRQSQELAQKT